MVPENPLPRILKNKKIQSIIKVTNEHIFDNKMLSNLVDEIVESDVGAASDKLLSEGDMSNSGHRTNNSMISNSGANTNVFHAKEIDATKYTLRVGNTYDPITGNNS